MLDVSTREAHLAGPSGTPAQGPQDEEDIQTSEVSGQFKYNTL